MVVAFQGEHGAYSEEALRKHFGEEAESLPCRTFRDIFRAVVGGKADHGVLPVENAFVGSVNDSYELLREYDLRIIAEIIHPIRHMLIGLPGAERKNITRALSHHQALEQCSVYLKRHNIEPVPTYDTAGSAIHLKDEADPETAIIASRLAAEIYELDILEAGIENVSFNYTRFFALGHDDPPRAQQNKTTLVFSTRHKPGSLYRCLKPFAERGINLTKIESRPSRERPWSYVFYMDFQGHWKDPICEQALLDLLRTAGTIKVLGSYPAATTPIWDEPEAGA
jgi:prephenate dehydratase